MSKRSAPPSPLEDQIAQKKLKITHDAADPASAPTTPTPESVEPMTPEVIAAQEPTDIDMAATKDEAFKEVATPQAKASKGKTAKGKASAKPALKQPPVAQGFVPWTPDITDPPPSKWWGIKPTSKDPLPHPDQPSARTSMAAVNPPLWEDLGFRIKRGSRYVKYFGSIAPEGAEDGPDLDQEQLLTLKLIDMRPISKNDQNPRRAPIHYAYEHGKPVSWSDKQSIKALNDRRTQAISRITGDSPFSRFEREYLAQLCKDNDDASIWMLASLFNDHFMGQEHTASTAFDFHELSSGRTTESVRHEYMTYKPAYDKGEAPEGVRYRNDDSAAGKALRVSKKMVKIFGPPSKALEKEFDEASGATADDEAGEVSDDDGKATPKKKAKKPAPKMVSKGAEPTVPFKDQPKLSHLGEELLELAGAYDDDGETRAASASFFPALNFDWISSSPISDVPDSDNEEDDETTTTETSAEAGPVVNVNEEDKVVEQLVSGSVDDAVHQALQCAEEIQQVQESQTPSKVTTIAEDNSTVTETVETQVDIPVQITATPTQLPATSPVSAAPLHAARLIDVDEDYDDCEDEEL